MSEALKRLMDAHNELLDHPARKAEVYDHSFKRLLNSFVLGLRGLAAAVKGVELPASAQRQLDLYKRDLPKLLASDDPPEKRALAESLLSHLHTAVSLAISAQAEACGLDPLEYMFRHDIADACGDLGEEGSDGW